MNSKSFLAVAASALLGIQAAGAAIVVYFDKADFLSATGASSATGPLPNLGYAGASATIGSLTINAPSTFFVGPVYSPDSTNSIAINGPEDLDVFSAAPVHSLGFDFYEPTWLTFGNCCLAPSTFQLTLGTGEYFTFDAPDDAWSFIGVHSDAAFSSAAIREIAGGIDDEYFGEFYTGTRPLAGPQPAVPEPSVLALFGLGLLAAAAYGRRNRQAK